MTWSAIDALADAYDATEQLLWPIVLSRWAVLGIVAFFISGASGVNPSFNVNLGELITPLLPIEVLIDDRWVPNVPGREFVLNIGTDQFTIGPELLAGVWIAVVGIVLVAILIGVVGAILEFAFVEMLISVDIRIRGRFLSHAWNGTAVFLLRLLVGVAALIGGIVVTVLTVLSGGLAVVGFVIASPLFVIAGILVWGVLRFTVDFVVPIMLADNIGLIEAWRRFGDELRMHWPEYGLYAIIRVLLGIAVAIFATLGLILVALLLALPFGLIGIGIVGASWAITGNVTIGPAVGVLFGLYVLTVGVVSIISVHVPLQTYLRYYSLFVLAGVSPQWDVLNDVRDRLPGPAGGIAGERG